MSDTTNTGKLVIRRTSGAGNELPAGEDEQPGRVVLRKKRVIKLDRPERVTKVENKPAVKPRKKPKVAPSRIRESDLNKVLSIHSKAWRAHWPLSVDIEKQVFQYIGANHLSASKRVVVSLLKKHRTAKNYLLNEVMDAARHDLNDQQCGVVTWEQASKAAKRLIKVEAQREADKRTKQKVRIKK